MAPRAVLVQTTEKERIDHLFISGKELILGEGTGTKRKGLNRKNLLFMREE